MNFKKPKFWKSINFFSLTLLPLSLITIILNYIKKISITGQRFRVPVICIGNIYIGGTGKTPLSIFIYNLLKKKKLKPAIVRKYYKSHLDEINLIENKVKNFFLEKDRISSIIQAEQKKSNIIILDDGLQDISITTDLNICCFNSQDLIGNGFLLPAGQLRERLNKVKNCGIIVINGKRNVSFEKKLKLLSNNIKIFQSKYEIKNIKRFRGKQFLAFAGIGNPNNFFSLLKENGLKIKDEISFPDHYSYSENEIRGLIENAKIKNLKLITTEKDFFRIKPLGLKKIDYVSVDLKITKYKDFEKEVLKNI